MRGTLVGDDRLGLLVFLLAGLARLLHRKLCGADLRLRLSVSLASCFKVASRLSMFDSKSSFSSPLSSVVFSFSSVSP